MSYLVLLSGGIDSATVLAMLRGKHREAIGFRYGQPHAIELEYARQVAEREGVPFEILDLPMMPKTNELVFAGRNGVFLAMGVSIAMARGLEAVAIGSNYSDWQDFPDCRPAFVKDMSEAFGEAYGVRIAAPLLRMSKPEVVRLARELGVDLPSTWTCYSPKDGKPCGKCYSCASRQAAGA